MRFFWILRLWYLSDLKFAVVPFPVPNQLYDHNFCPLFLKYCVSFRFQKLACAWNLGNLNTDTCSSCQSFITPWLVTTAHEHPQKTHLLTFTQFNPIHFKFTDRPLHPTLICKPLAEATTHSVSAFSNHTS